MLYPWLQSSAWLGAWHMVLSKRCASKRGCAPKTGPTASSGSSCSPATEMAPKKFQKNPHFSDQGSCPTAAKVHGFPGASFRSVRAKSLQQEM